MILRKPPEKLLAMRHPVYDTDSSVADADRCGLSESLAAMDRGRDRTAEGFLDIRTLGRWTDRDDRHRR